MTGVEKHGCDELVAAALATMRRDGWIIIEDLVDAAALDAAEAEVRRLLAETPTGRDAFEGFDTQRIYALAGKTRAMDPMLVHPVVTGICNTILGDGFRVSSATTIAIGPGERAQSLHYDAQVYYQLPRPEPQVVVNTMWALTPFTEANGATRIVPRSHDWPTGERPAAGAETIAAEMPRANSR